MKLPFDTLFQQRQDARKLLTLTTHIRYALCGIDERSRVLSIPSISQQLLRHHLEESRSPK